MDYKLMAEELVKRCLKKGAEEAEVYIESGRNLTIEVRNGDIETVQEAANQGAGIRVFVKGRAAFSSSNDLSEKALDNTIASAIGFAGITTPDENNVLPDDKGITAVEELYDPKIAAVTMEEKIDLAKKTETLAMKDSRITKSAGAVYGENEGEVFLANSLGLAKNSRYSVCTFGVSVVAEKGDQKTSGGEYCSRRFWADLKSPAIVAEEAAKKAFEMLDPRMVKTQKAAVIFDPDVSYAILGGILSAVNGERVLQGASFLGSKLGQKIASELVTIIDDGTRGKGLGSASFDGEGVPTQKTLIIEKGILKAYMYNAAVAKRAGMKSTGNASRDGFSSVPGIGPHNFFMAAGQMPPGEIIKGTKTGLWLKEVTGYGINPVNGNFSGGASGLWIEDGKVAFPVKGLTIAGSAFEMFNAIDMVGNDLDPNKAFTAPTFRISLLQIGGE